MNKVSLHVALSLQFCKQLKQLENYWCQLPAQQKQSKSCESVEAGCCLSYSPGKAQDGRVVLTATACGYTHKIMHDKISSISLEIYKPYGKQCHIPANHPALAGIVNRIPVFACAHTQKTEVSGRRGLPICQSCGPYQHIWKERIIMCFNSMNRNVFVTCIVNKRFDQKPSSICMQ